MSIALKHQSPSYLVTKPETCRELIHERIWLVVNHLRKALISAEIADDEGLGIDLRQAASQFRVALDVHTNLKEAANKGGRS
jgi:hypothetical protein